ncbi:hypothetical protein OPQ81_003801 [Rhizoctonia solani]|nr:hypothetical protein OPQ81_003801 [Rhizoctonia solani]
MVLRVLSTPAQSPRSTPTSSDQFVEHLIDPTGVTEDFSHFTLNPLPSEVALPDSSSETSLDTVAYDLNDELFSLQLGSTKYFIARDRLELYEQLSSAHIDSNFRSLAPEDRLHLVSLHCIEYPMLPTSSAYTPAPMTTPGNSSSTGNTASISTIIIADKNYSINKLQGQEDYQIWRIQVEDMFQDVEVWDIVNKTSTRPSNNDPTGQATWDKKNRAALGALRRRVDTGPMTHVARCMLVSEAWKILKNQYRSLGVATMTMLRNKFTSLRMSKGDDLESHIKELRKIFNDLNIALLAESTDQLKEIEFIRQLLVSLPESWQILMSVIPQHPEPNDTDGTKLSIDIQSRLLAEYHHRKSQNAEKALFARNCKVPHSLCGRFSQSPSARIENICQNCNIPGHKRHECRKPGGGAYKGNNQQNNAPRNRGNSRRPSNSRNYSNNRRNNRPNDTRDNDEHANFAAAKEFAYSFNFSHATPHSTSRELITAPYDPLPTFSKSPNCVQQYFSKYFQHFSFSIQSLAQYGIGLDDAWIINSGASCHVTNRCEHL